MDSGKKLPVAREYGRSKRGRDLDNIDGGCVPKSFSQIWEADGRQTNKKKSFSSDLGSRRTRRSHFLQIWEADRHFGVMKSFFFKSGKQTEKTKKKTGDDSGRKKNKQKNGGEIKTQTDGGGKPNENQVCALI